MYPVWFNLIIVDRRKLRLLKIGSPLLSGREEQNGTSGTLQSGFTAWTVEMQRLQRELIAHACGPGRPYGSCTVLRRPPLGPARCCYAVTLTTTVLWDCGRPLITGHEQREGKSLTVDAKVYECQWHHSPKDNSKALSKVAFNKASCSRFSFINSSIQVFF